MAVWGKWLIEGQTVPTIGVTEVGHYFSFPPHSPALALRRVRYCWRTKRVCAKYHAQAVFRTREGIGQFRKLTVVYHKSFAFKKI